MAKPRGGLLLVLAIITTIAFATSVAAQQQAPRAMASAQKHHHGKPSPPKESRVCSDIKSCSVINGLLAVSDFQPFVTEFVLEFIKQRSQIVNLQNQLQALTNTYNGLARSVSDVVASVAAANLTAPPTFSNETDGGNNPLCGAPRKLSRNSFITSFIIKDPSKNSTKCTTAILTAYKDALIKNVNILDKCAKVGNTRVEVIDASCDEFGASAYLTASVEVYSFYPCNDVPWFRAVTKNGDTETECGPANPDPACTCNGIAEPVCKAITDASLIANLIIVNNGVPLTVRESNCGTCLDRNDVFCSPDNYKPSCGFTACTGP